MSQLTEQTVVLDPEEVLDFSRRNEAKLIEIERQFNARIVLRGSMLKIMGAAEEVEQAIAVIQELRLIRRKGGSLTQQEFKHAVRHAATTAKRAPKAAKGEKGSEPRGFDRPISEIFLDDIPLPLKRRRLSPITGGQKTYIETIRKKDIVFGIGPAGTGKTYLAVAMAVSALISGKVSRIILCRPAVEAGEKLGFLPGDMKEKLDPYVRPLYDALYEMMEGERIREALATGVIEIAPLAFMRGRTLNNSFIILDEAQNTTPEQMKMFLTRLGFESKAVITGDVTQMDLPKGMKSGLVHVQEVLTGLDDIGFVHFDQKDVVRHDLVMKIVAAYEKFDKVADKKKPVRGRSDD